MCVFCAGRKRFRLHSVNEDTILNSYTQSSFKTDFNKSEIMFVLCSFSKEQPLVLCFHKSNVELVFWQKMARFHKDFFKIK